MAYRLIQPNKGWIRVLWHRDLDHSLEVKLALSIVREIPGVGVGEGWAEFPHTTSMLPVVRDAIERMGLDMIWFGAPQVNAATLWRPKRPLYNFQAFGALTLLSERGVVLADEMGLGKSAQAIVAAETTRRSYDRPGIIVGPLFVRETWKQELLALGAIEDESQFCALVSRDFDDASFRSKGVRWYFVHYAVVRAWWPQLMLDQRWRPCVAIVDEAHYVRNSRTDRAKGALMVTAQCAKRFLLTGTPIDNRPSDLWNLLTLATGPRTWGGPNDFRRRYAGAYHNGYGLQDGDHPTHVDELRARIAPYFLRRSVADVSLELPPMTRSVQRVQLDKSRQHEHDEVLGTAGVEVIVRAITTGAMRDDVLKILTRLRQVTSEAKIAATVEYVGNVLEQGESCIVFFWERQTATALASRLGGLSGGSAPKFLVHGGFSQEERDWAVQVFQRDGGVMVATYGALAEGVTLHRARIVVLHDLDYVLSKMLQAEKRIHRVGQHRACQSVWMVADGSIDSMLVPILFKKAQLSNALLDISEGESAFTEMDLVPADRIEEEVQHALRVWRNHG